MSEKKPRNVFVEGEITASFIGESIAKHRAKTNIGAHHIFLGQIRDDLIDDKRVCAIEYTCYEEMALEKIHEIREAIFEKYELICLHIYHSLGRVNVGGISLFVFASSKHRRAATEACGELVERIKKELPIWGKEILEDDSYAWKQNTNG